MLLQLGSKCFCLFYFLKNITLNFVTADEFLEISIYMHICIMYIYICIYIKNNKQQYIYKYIYIYIYTYINVLRAKMSFKVCLTIFRIMLQDLWCVSDHFRMLCIKELTPCVIATNMFEDFWKVYSWSYFQFYGTK